MQGLINILKPTGLTSSDVVVRIRKILSNSYNQKVKVGHLGTLDPGAAGVLPIAVGNAVKLFELLTRKNKKYRAIICFGKQTDTLDSYGVVTETSPIIPTIGAIKDAIPSFIGNISQVPPEYSAIKICGRKAYNLARSGESIKLNSRQVTVNSIDILDFADGVLTVDIDCMGGTYIRSIVRDLAIKLNTVAYMSCLIRLSAGNMTIVDSVTLDEFAISLKLLPIESALYGSQKYVLDSRFKKALVNGVQIKRDDMPSGQFIIYLCDRLFGIGSGINGKLKVDIRLYEE